MDGDAASDDRPNQCASGVMYQCRNRVRNLFERRLLLLDQPSWPLHSFVPIGRRDVPMVPVLTRFQCEYRTDCLRIQWGDLDGGLNRSSLIPRWQRGGRRESDEPFGGTLARTSPQPWRLGRAPEGGREFALLDDDNFRRRQGKPGACEQWRVVVSRRARALRRAGARREGARGFERVTLPTRRHRGSAAQVGPF